MTTQTATRHEPIQPGEHLPYFRAVFLQGKRYPGALCPRCGEIIPNPQGSYGPARHWEKMVADAK